MSAESRLTAVAVIRTLLDEDTGGLAVLLPDGLPEPGRFQGLADVAPPPRHEAVNTGRIAA